MGGGRHLLPPDLEKKTLLHSARATSGRRTGRRGKVSAAPSSGGAGTERCLGPYPSQQNPVNFCLESHSRGLFIRVQVCLQSFPEFERGKLSPKPRDGCLWAIVCVFGKGAGGGLIFVWDRRETGER